jgi:hypothetical protein
VRPIFCKYLGYDYDRLKGTIEPIKKDWIMWFGLFITFCIGVMVWDIVSDPHYIKKMKELEED